MEFSDWFSKYGAIIIGLVVGALAHLGRLIGDEKMPTIKQFLGYMMQLGLIGLIAVYVTKTLSIDDNDTRALVTALFAISAQEVVQAAKKHGWKGLLKAVLRGLGLKISDDIDFDADKK